MLLGKGGLRSLEAALDNNAEGTAPLKILICSLNSHWSGRNWDIEMNQPLIRQEARCLPPSARPGKGHQAHSGPGRRERQVSS